MNYQPQLVRQVSSINSFDSNIWIALKLQQAHPLLNCYTPSRLVGGFNPSELWKLTIFETTTKQLWFMSKKYLFQNPLVSLLKTWCILKFLFVGGILGFLMDFETPGILTRVLLYLQQHYKNKNTRKLTSWPKNSSSRIKRCQQLKHEHFVGDPEKVNLDNCIKLHNIPLNTNPTHERRPFLHFCLRLINHHDPIIIP